MKKAILFFGLFLCLAHTRAQGPAENLVIVTFDGLRWQEVFGGADSLLLADKKFTDDSAGLVKKFWAPTPEERRRRLFPFLWTTVAQNGQLHGNRREESKVNVKNPYWFSYPGYNEIFTGYPDTAVNSNGKKDNGNVTVFEYLNGQPALKGRVAAFASWEVFNFIFNENRCGFPVNAGIEAMAVGTPRFDLLNGLQAASFKPFEDSLRPDLLTYYLAKEYLLVKKPRLLYIGFDDTDDWAHKGRYDYYLQAAHLIDGYLADLWQTLQTLPAYKNKTTLIITTDHGRGDAVKKEWTSHGKSIAGADQIWMGFLGKGVDAKGEAKGPEQLYQAQLAQTVAKLLGYTFTAAHPVEKSLEGALKK